MKDEQIAITDVNGLIITAAIESNVFNWIDIQYGPMIFHYELEEFHLDELYIQTFKPDLIFNVSNKTTDMLYDLKQEYPKQAVMSDTPLKSA